MLLNENPECIFDRLLPRPSCEVNSNILPLNRRRFAFPVSQTADENRTLRGSVLLLVSISTAEVRTLPLVQHVVVAGKTTCAPR